MNNTEQSDQNSVIEQPAKKSYLSQSKALIAAAIVLAGGSLAVGYNVGHKQGLTAVGYDADAQDLAEIVEKQKQSLNSVSVALNTATQERDVAIDNAKQLSDSLNQAKQDKNLSESLSNTYRQKLRERGGLSLTIQNLAVKPLPGNAYEYVLDLVQVSPNNRRIAGRAELHLIQGTEVVVIPMESANFNFDNYERLTGRWTMPNGFNPQFIEVHLNAAGEPITQRFIWQKGKQEIESSAFITEIPKTQANAE
ncbi:hypothetical protein F4V57_05400 [Acinetobacter qingfengensis]|uniref:Uncharacterized protein n=1 Tax=Acinetobacter qingfengensis TaxID=1262585 RepID=A0A1E7RDU6_9GAMM|nr:DUF6776 family protein [Acinetobacter qingfengensis]KAA8734401.1 hypothetical protein F4V57_05400 [Acinetobacter qingfengensis]OEY97589.1 hypothetical protein BJI46_08900 [Acinetobacter qingfengensis]